MPLSLRVGTQYDASVSESAAATWLVVPTYNEAANIERFVAEVRTHLPERRHILIVDDNSPDGTGGIADRIADASDDVTVLHRPTKEGLGPAYIEGFEFAIAHGATLLISMDADFSHDPADLERMIARAEGSDGSMERADVVIGSRYVPEGEVVEWGPLRRAISKGGSAYARFTLGVGVRDLTGGFKCYRREVLEQIDLPSLRARGYAFQVETTYRAIRQGFRVVEIPIKFVERRAGSSKMSKSIFAEAVWRVPAMRLSRPRACSGEAPDRTR